MYNPFIGANKSVNRLRKWIFRGFVIVSFSSHLVTATNSNVQTPHSLLTHQNAARFVSIESKPLGTHRFKQADFKQESASQDTRHVANWVVDSNDNHNMPFVIVNKTDAKVFVFNPDGQLRGVAPALLGMSRGDDAIPGIGNWKLSRILPNERTTPAGRFVASLDHDLKGEEILWVNYDTAISLHRVHTTNFQEHRAQRLSSPTVLDNRISFGCINVPVDFYKRVVSPAFTGTNGIVYVLPETRSLSDVFDLYDVTEYELPQTKGKLLVHEVLLPK